MGLSLNKRVYYLKVNLGYNRRVTINQNSLVTRKFVNMNQNSQHGPRLRVGKFTGISNNFVYRVKSLRSQTKSFTISNSDNFGNQREPESIQPEAIYQYKESTTAISLSLCLYPRDYIYIYINICPFGSSVGTV